MKPNKRKIEYTKDTYIREKPGLSEMVPHCDRCFHVMVKNGKAAPKNKRERLTGERRQLYLCSNMECRNPKTGMVDPGHRTVRPLWLPRLVSEARSKENEPEIKRGELIERN